MPDYLAPGIYTDEVIQGRSPIVGLPTSIAGFVGGAARGPLGVVSAPLSGLADFERIYGAPDRTSAPDDAVNHLWHAARGFFASGGSRLHVVRIPLSRRRSPPGPVIYRKAFDALARQEDIALVAAPGASLALQSHAILSALIEHAQASPNRFALIDSVPGHDAGTTIALRKRFESSRAAFYYPWLRVVDPSGRDSLQPPSGFVAGIMARVDAGRGIWKAPANETIDVAGLERDLTNDQQDMLGNQNVNCIRAFRGRGIRLWGARTLSSDPEWRYVNTRRLTGWIEQSIMSGTRWVVFEPNDEQLWQRLKSDIELFLAQLFDAGAFFGSSSADGFFVKCDRTTMTQADIDAGRIVCLIGMATARPAEFTILRLIIKA